MECGRSATPSVSFSLMYGEDIIIGMGLDSSERAHDIAGELASQ
jgi:hypothetical protein